MPEHNNMPEGHGRGSRKHFTPDTKLNVQPMVGGLSGLTVFPGKRHPFGIRVRVVDSDLLRWLRRGESFIAGTDANALLVQLVTAIGAGREADLPKAQAKRCVIVGGKVRIGGHLGTSSGVAMIQLSTTQPCPVSRVIDLMTAFKDVNRSWLKSTELKAKSATKRMGKNRHGTTAEGF